MQSNEKLMLNILRDYYICKLYVKTSASTRTISGLTKVPLSITKRALHLVETKKEECLSLLPIALKKAYQDGVIKKIDLIDEKTLDLLQAEIDLLTVELQEKNKWASSAVELNNDLIKIVSAINDKYFSDKRDIVLTKIQVKRLIDSGKSFKEAADILGIAKTTAHNYYKKGITQAEEEAYQEELNAKKR